MVLIVVHPYNELARMRAQDLIAWLAHQHIEACIVDHVETCDLSRVMLVVSLGGDGTLLRAAHMVQPYEIPIVGISFGHLGFLTAAGPDQLYEIVGSALAGELHVSRRSTLTYELTCSDAQGTFHQTTGFALNEIALNCVGLSTMVEFDIGVSGHHIDRLRGDGFVVASATGSTGYALAAGGPIVEPDFAGMVCVPIAPHTLQARAFLTSPSDVVELAIRHERPAPAQFFADGQLIACGEGSTPHTISVKRGEQDVLLLNQGTQSFYGSVSRVFYGHAGAQA